MNDQSFIAPSLLEGVGPINAAAKTMAKQMGVNDPREVFRRINSGQWIVVSAYSSARSWREEEGVIYFSVTSDGTTGEDWIKRPEGNGFRVVDYAKQVLRSPDFKPTSGVTTEVAVLKGMLFEDSNRITKKIRAEANKRKLVKPNAELACLIREKFTDKEIEAMGLIRIVAMHEPINDSDGVPRLLCAYRYDGGRWLGAYGDMPDGRWHRGDGFALAVSQVSSQP